MSLELAQVRSELARVREDLACANRTISTLRNLLSYYNVNPDLIKRQPEWTRKLNPQPASVAMMLLRAHPHGLSRAYIEENMLRTDHAREYKSTNVVNVVVSKIRSVFPNSIETIHGSGFICSDEFAKAHKHTLD